MQERHGRSHVITGSHDLHTQQIYHNAKQQQIVKTAKDLFFQHGVRRVAVEEIYRKANVSKITFYKYFRDKFALVEHIVLQMLDEA
ncbi:MAG: helix-turn-helix transcriptional regulator [bacterium]|nr:helix-turn-helix transcriptional regulator [bacterium]